MLTSATAAREVATVESRRTPADASGAGAGTGHVTLALVDGRTAVVGRRAASPLKLLTPRGAADVARVVTSSYGGGLLAGDDIRLAIAAGERTRCIVGTQASTKVYRSGGVGQPARQSVVATVADDAILAVAPDPVTCFAGSSFEGVQRYELSPRGSLLSIEWLTSGRVACGERWAFDRYRTETRIAVGGRAVAHDALLLDPTDGRIDAPHRMGRFDCLATVFLVGPAFRVPAAGIVKDVAAVPLRRRATTIVTASPVADGAVLRVIGAGAEGVGRVLRSLLKAAFDAVGDEPWGRKW